MDDNDRTEEDWDGTRTQRSEEVDLFDEGTSVHRGPSGPSGQKMENGPGEQELL